MTAAMNAETAASVLKKKQEKKKSSSLTAASKIAASSDTASSDKSGAVPASSTKSKHKDGKGGNGMGGEDTQEEWVQCDSCARWRTLPAPGAALYPQHLPEKWTCSMNTWHPEKASCRWEEIMKGFVLPVPAITDVPAAAGSFSHI